MAFGGGGDFDTLICFDLCAIQKLKVLYVLSFLIPPRLRVDACVHRLLFSVCVVLKISGSFLLGINGLFFFNHFNRIASSCWCHASVRSPFMQRE